MEQNQDQASESKRSPRFKTDNKPKPRKKNLVSNILIVVGVVLLLVAAGIYLYNANNYRKIDEGNERVAATYAKLTEDPGLPPTVDWEALKAMNPDVVGWLEIPNTVVNYPVFQGPDNDYYLERAPDGSDSIGGAVFLDYENTAPGLVDSQTIIYGHHMRNGSQFKQIADMDKQELFDGVSTVWYVTEQGAFKLSPLFLFYTTETDTEVRQFQFDSPDQYHAYLNTYLGKAVTKRADAEQLIGVLSRTFALSTCNYYDGYGRTILVCALTSEIPGTPEYEAMQAARAQAEAEAQAAAAAQEQAPQEAEQEVPQGEEQPAEEG
ncbi:MAG: class B sortase [Coriobacteriales bacterium]|nr:class B sortase [Coriobacteriales bacterium]